MSLGDIFTAILSSALGSTEATYRKMARSSDLTEEQRYELLKRADRRKTLREGGLKGYMEAYMSNDDDSYDSGDDY